MIVWQNGRLRLDKEVKVSPFDPGFTVGEGVFETMLSLKGKIFAWSRHEERLKRSAEILGLNIPRFLNLEKAMEEVVQANEHCREKARVRISITAHENVLVTAQPISEPPVEVKVVTSDLAIHEKSPLSQAKTLSYAENLYALKQAVAQGADEAIRPNTLGELCEASVSNVFFVIEGQIRTPDLRCGCLSGITRALILEAFPEIQIGHWPLEILKEAQEVWLSSSIRRLQWVSELDGRDLGAPSTFFQKVRGDLDQKITHMNGAV